MTAPQVLSVARWIERSRVNGPGERFVLWVQGCSIRCPGCWNRDTWDSRPGGTSLEELLATIGQVQGIEGVTLTGGEPFDQAHALEAVALRCRARGLSVMVFTGYTLDELRAPDKAGLFAMVDIVVAGRYVASERTLELPWRGSRNQEVHFVSSRYSRADIPSDAQTEVHIASDGQLVITGFPPPGLIGRQTLQSDLVTAH